MKKVVSLASPLSIALASCLAAPTHSAVPPGNPLAAGESHSLFISNPVPNPIIITPWLIPQNVVRGMGHHSFGGSNLGSIPAPINNAFPHTVGCRAPSPPPPIGDYPLALVVQVAAGVDHSVALRSNGDVVTFGSGHDGALGYDSTLADFNCPSYFSAPVPLNVVGAGKMPVWAVAAGRDTTFALQGNWAGYSIIKAWGRSTFGQLGTGKPSGPSNAVPDCVRNNVYPLGTCVYPVASVAAGYVHGAAVTTDGKVHTWGANYFGQLGQPGSTGNIRNYALVVPGIDNVVSVTASDYITFALKQDGTVWCWGRFLTETESNHSWLSCGATPTQVPNLSGVTAIAAGANHALAITVDGRVWGWGYNTYGGVGDPSTTFTLAPVLVNVPGFAVAVAAGMYHSLARTSDGKTWAWGRGTSGQLGDGTGLNRFSPVQVLP